MKIQIIKNKNSGFSLIEAIIYVAILGTFIFAFVSFSNMMTTSRINNQIILEINNQGNQAIKTITRYIRNSTAFSISNSSTLDLTTPNGNVNFSVSGGILNITEGQGPIALTNNKVIVNNLVFLNLSQNSTAENIKINLTLESNSNTTPVTFYGSASIRK